MASTHTVKDGETMLIIAIAHGFRDWQAIYNHASNADLRRRRPNPDILYPGDKVFIPDKTNKPEMIATTKTHTFVVRKPEQILRLVVQDPCWHPIANENYEFRAGGSTARGKTDGSGRIVRKIPPDLASAELVVRGYTWKLEIGRLHPVEDDTGDHGISGAQARLLNMAYDTGKVDGISGDRTKKALTQFQSDNSLTRNGTLDDQTRTRLRSAHGC